MLFNFQGPVLFNLLSRDSLFSISYCFVFVNRFFKIFLSGFSEEKHHSLQPISRSFVQSVRLPRVSLYIISRPHSFVNTFFRLFLFFFLSWQKAHISSNSGHTPYCIITKRRNPFAITQSHLAENSHHSCSQSLFDFSCCCQRP